MSEQQNGVTQGGTFTTRGFFKGVDSVIGTSKKNIVYETTKLKFKPVFMKNKNNEFIKLEPEKQVVIAIQYDFKVFSFDKIKELKGLGKSKQPFVELTVRKNTYNSNGNSKDFYVLEKAEIISNPTNNTNNNPGSLDAFINDDPNSSQSLEGLITN